MIIRSFFKLFAGTMAVQILTLFFYPILSRIYGPSEFGSFGLVSSSGILLGILISGQYQMAFPQIKEGEEVGHTLFVSSFFYIFFMSCFLMLAAYLGIIAWVIKAETVFWIIPVFTFSVSLNELMKMWLIYLRKYGQSSWFVSLNRLSSNTLKVFFPKTLGLIISDIFANLILFVIYSRSVRWRVYFRPRLILTTIKSYSFYPIFYSFGALAQTLQQELPVFMFKRLFSSEDVGFYVMANKLTVQSIMIVSSSLVLVLANKSVSSGADLMRQLYRTAQIAVPISIISFLSLYFLGDEIFALFLGSDWVHVGSISAYLSLLIFPKMIFSPIYAQILKTGKVRFISILRVLQIFGLLAVFYMTSDKDFFYILKCYVIYDFVTDILITGFSFQNLKGKKLCISSGN